MASLAGPVGTVPSLGSQFRRKGKFADNLLWQEPNVGVPNQIFCLRRLNQIDRSKGVSITWLTSCQSTLI